MQLETVYRSTNESSLNIPLVGLLLAKFNIDLLKSKEQSHKQYNNTISLNPI